MSDSLVEKLLGSFDELENCIEITRDVLGTKEGVPSDVIERIEQYSGIVEKQPGLAHELRALIDGEDWDEVGRRVKLINGLSSMIRDDAYAILEGAGALPSNAQPKAAYSSKEYLS